MEGAMLLQDKVALITGAGQGIGRALALAFAREGAAVVVNDINAVTAETVTREITEAGGRALAAPGSVSDRAVVEPMIERAAETFGRLDILINNAGILRDRMVFNMEEEEWDAVIATHLRAAFLCTRFASRRMRQQGTGRIINVTSRSGLLGNVGQANYSAAKAGLVGLTLTTAQELNKYGITVNALSPRAETGMTASVPAAVRARRDASWAGSSVRRRGTPEEVAPLALFLASDRAAHVNGQIISIGGDKLALWSAPREVAEAFVFGGWSLQNMLELFDSSVGFQLQSLAKKD
jgi:NAD(P)-dependent dehydrogenase (short-subunit alcohol dehydrogenase family)